MTTEDQQIYDAAVLKIGELQQRVQWAAKGWLDDCWSRGLHFKIIEAYRSQARQEELYKIGRRGIKGELPVTWTKSSLHSQRLAFDLRPMNCTYEQIQAIAATYGVTRPLVYLGDLGHFEFNKVGDPPLTIKLPSYAVQLTQVVKAIARYSGRTLTKLEEMRLRLLGRKKEHLEELNDQE